MATWSELKDFARSSFKLAEERDYSFKVVFKYPGGRLQAVIASHYEAMGRIWVDFSSACCRADRMDAKDALEHGFNLAVGAVCLDGDVYVIRHTVLLDGIRREDVPLHLHAVARAADQIERSLGRSRPVRASMLELADDLQ
ncbi:MAG: hypothetical protein AAF500_16935 [Myxococcota bacterium]